MLCKNRRRTFTGACKVNGFVWKSHAYALEKSKAVLAGSTELWIVRGCSAPGFILIETSREMSTYMDCMASWMSCIQVLRSSLELARTSIISGFSMPAVMRKRPRSSLATSLTISFWREITVERWSCRGDERGAKWRAGGSSWGGG